MEIFIPLKPYVDFSVIYFIKTSVVALFPVKPMFSVNLMSVKVMHHCIFENFVISKKMSMVDEVTICSILFDLFDCMTKSKLHSSWVYRSFMTSSVS